MKVYKVVMVGVNSEWSGTALKQAQHPCDALNQSVQDLPIELRHKIDTVTITEMGLAAPQDQSPLLLPKGRI